VRRLFKKELKEFSRKYPEIVACLPRLEAALSAEKYVHSIGTMITAEDLMAHFTSDETLIRKAVIAGILHDCAKCMNQREASVEYGINSANTSGGSEEASPAVLHSIIGTFVAQQQYCIVDIEILNAIRYHTTGRANMTLLDKVIYLADSFEPARGYEDSVLNLARTKRDIDIVLLEQLELNIKLVIQKGMPLNLDTVRARNFLLVGE